MTKQSTIFDDLPKDVVRILRSYLEDKLSREDVLEMAESLERVYQQLGRTLKVCPATEMPENISVVQDEEENNCWFYLFQDGEYYCIQSIIFGKKNETIHRFDKVEDFHSMIKSFRDRGWQQLNPLLNLF